MNFSIYYYSRRIFIFSVSIYSIQIVCVHVILYIIHIYIHDIHIYDTHWIFHLSLSFSLKATNDMHEWFLVIMKLKIATNYSLFNFSCVFCLATFLAAEHGILARYLNFSHRTNMSPQLFHSITRDRDKLNLMAITENFFSQKNWEYLKRK